MTTTWVVVAHRAGARVFEHRTGHETKHQLTEVRELDHEQGRKKSGQLDSDRSGQSFTGQRGATGTRSMGQEETSHEHVAVTFAKSLADILNTARVENKLDAIVLVAEPHFLGLLQGALDKTTAKAVTGTVHKDLVHVPGHAMFEHVRHALPI